MSMTMILCIGCRRATVSHPSGRCVSCRALRQLVIDSHPARQARKRALYGPEHRAARRLWAPIVAAGAVICRRCKQRIKPGARWDLGHGEGSRPEHADCNRGDRSVAGASS